jgi:putative inorganic carbon (HCO3(-)) transporter
MSVDGRSAGPTPLARRFYEPGSAGPAAYAALVCVAAAVLGLLYALGAYRVDAVLPPLLVGGAIAVGLGVWRLEYGLAMLILVAPFTENAGITDVGEARLRVALVGWAAALVVIQCYRALANRQRLTVPPMAIPTALLVVAALIAVPVATDETSAASKFMLLAGSVSVYLLIAMFLDEWSKLWPVLVALVAVGLIIAGHAVYQYVTGDLSRVGFLNESGSVEYRIASFFPHPNQLAGFLVILAPVALGVAGATRSGVLRAAAVLLSVLAVVGVVLTYSRGGLVALIALPVVLIRDKRSWPLAVAAIALIVLLAPDVWRDRVAEVSKTDRPEIATRLDFWEASIQMFEQQPVAGVGLDGFDEAYQALERPGRAYITGGVLSAPDTAHNLYLNTLAEQGLIGFTALCVFLGAFLAMTLRLRRAADPRIRALALGLLGAGVVAVVHNFFDVTFSDPKNATILWVLIGIGAALTRIAQRTPPDERATP